MSKLTVAELKKAIADLPDEMLVMVDGYEGGVQSAEIVETENVYYSGKSKYMGDHEKYCSSHEPRNDVFEVLYIG